MLLRQSRILHGPVGDGLSGHPGVSVTGRFADPVHHGRGATQGHEVTGLRDEALTRLMSLASADGHSLPEQARRIVDALELLTKPGQKN